MLNNIIYKSKKITPEINLKKNTHLQLYYGVITFDNFFIL